MSASIRDMMSTCGAFARSLYSYHVDGSPRPFSASLAITNHCNLRCDYCNAPFMAPGGLPLEKLELLFDRLYAIGIRRLGLFGGEPLVRKDCEDVARAAKARGFYVSINSNLNLYDRFPGVFDHVDIVMTSIDGHRELHEEGRGKGSFDGVIAGVRDLRRRGKKVVAICVVRDEALDRLDEALELSASLGIDVHFQPRSVDGRRARGALDETIDNDRRRAAWSHLLERKRAGAPVASSVFYLEHMMRWQDFSKTALFDPEQRCAAGHGFMFVDPHGNAYPCGFIEGQVEPFDMLADGWDALRFPKPPCTTCAVGPYVEFNQLFRHPLTAPIAAARTYLRGH
ncbi:MAG: radical SAM protein [Candidatus Binatia bacterium]